METSFQQLREYCPNGNDTTVAWPFFIMSARALMNDRVRQSFVGLSQSDQFILFVGDPDDHESGINYCELASALDKEQILFSVVVHNETLNRSGGWARKLKPTSLTAARLARTLAKWW